MRDADPRRATSSALASRRGFIRGAAAVTATLTASGAGPGRARAQEKDEVVIGFQNDLTGILAPYGYWYDKTAKAVIARINAQGGIAGKKVRLVSEDTESNVNLGIRKLRKLIEEDRADVVLGSLHSGVALGSAPIAQQLRTVYIPTANAQQVTGKNGNRWVFRTITNAEMIAQATVSPELVKEYGKRWAVLYADYAWGQSHFENWAPRLKKMGVEITSTIPVPLQTNDFFPHLAKMDRSSTAMLAVFFASDIIGLLKQRRDLGITVPVMGVTGVTAAVSPDVLKDAAGTLVPESLPRELRYKDTPGIRELRKAVGVDEHGKEIGSNRYLADSYFWATWENIYMVKRGMEEAKWRSKADNGKLVRALEGMKMEEGIEFPQGPKEVRPQDHQAFLDFYLSRISDKGGIDVVKKIDRQASVYPVNPPGTDYTKEPA
jgi:branched-chain amino acid transport system substrate-binding protein